MSFRAFAPLLLLALAGQMTRAAEPLPLIGPANAPVDSAPTNDAQAGSAAAAEVSTGATTPVVLRDFTIRPGFRLQLAAAAPLVSQPVALAFDASSRLFVLERISDTLGRVSLLVDTNADGQFDERTVFADNLASPTGLACYGDGLFVACATKIIFLKATRPSAPADIFREVILIHDSAAPTETPPPQLGLNSLAWGFDNRIHVANAGLTGFAQSISSTNTLNLRGRDFAFEPRTLELFAEPGGAHTGLGFDTRERRFTSAAASPAQLTLGDVAAAQRNPFFIWPQFEVALAAPPLTRPPATLSPSDGERAGAGSPSPTLFVYRGGALPTNFVDNVFITDAARGRISRLRLRENGLVPILESAPEDRGAEFLTSRDPAFRPVQIVSGPDGTLYVADLARTNLYDPGEHGRIWRMLPANFKPARNPDFAALKTPDFAELLSSPNGWVLDTATRLLFERRDTNTIYHLRRVLLNGKSPLAKLHTYQVLDGLGELTEVQVIAALRDRDERVRAAGAQLAEKFVRHGSVSPLLWNQLTFAAQDYSPRVRFLTGLTFSGIQHPGAATCLANIARAGRTDRWMQCAVLLAATGRAEAVFNELIGDARLRQTKSGWVFLRELAFMAGQQGGQGMDGLLLAIERAPLDPADMFAVARSAGEGLELSGQNFVRAAPNGTWRRFAAAAVNYATGTGSNTQRAEAARYLGVSGYTGREAGDWLLALLVPGESPLVQSAAIESLTRFVDPRITAAFVQRWPLLAPTSRTEIIAALLRRPDLIFALINALEQNRIPTGALTDVQVNFLRTYYDANLAARAVRLFGPQLNNHRGFAERFTPALKLDGSAPHGREVFNARCARCHEPDEDGNAYGPNLAAGPRDRTQLLEDILEPNRRIYPGFKTHVVQRVNSDFNYGLVSDHGPNMLWIRPPNAVPFILPRSQVEHLTQHEWSLMPEDATAGLSGQDLTDLLEYVATLPR